MKKLSWWLALILLILMALFIRAFRVTQSPPAPYWEEVALGYDAYSILQTGRDHHGNPWPSVAFESFGDWKPSGYFYALIPFIRVFGLNVFSVRLLSVLAGVGTVIGTGVLMRQATRKILSSIDRRPLILLTIFLAALSPWLIQFSRGAWEVNLATFFIVWGVVFGQQAIAVAQSHKQRFLWLTVCVLLLFAAMYTYHSARILAPALGLVMAWQFFQNDLRGRRKNVWLVGYILPLFLTAFLLKPFTTALGTPALGQRVTETSTFSDLSVIETSNQLKEAHGNSLFARAIYHRYVLFSGQVLSQYLTHFRPDFLFVHGDSNPRHSTQYFGLLYPFEILFLVTGGWWLARNLRRQHRQLLAVWLFFGILPSALTVGAPHALRILPAAPIFLLAIALGVWLTIRWLQQQSTALWPPIKRLVVIWPIGVLLIYLSFFVAYYRHLLVVYPLRFANEWQYGYEQMVSAVTQWRTENPALSVYITREQGRPAMYYWFYTQTDPNLVQAADAIAPQDQGEYLQFENIYFVRSLAGVTEPALIVGSPGELATFTDKAIVAQISNPAGEVIWQVAAIGQ